MPKEQLIKSYSTFCWSLVKTVSIPLLHLLRPACILCLQDTLACFSWCSSFKCPIKCGSNLLHYADTFYRIRKAMLLFLLTLWFFCSHSVVFWIDFAFRLRCELYYTDFCLSFCDAMMLNIFRHLTWDLMTLLDFTLSHHTSSDFFLFVFYTGWDPVNTESPLDYTISFSSTIYHLDQFFQHLVKLTRRSTRQSDVNFYQMPKELALWLV